MKPKTTNTLGEMKRPENANIKILDCTIRDGGLMNASRFSDEQVRTVYDTCADAGIDYMEIGFKNDKKLFSPDKYGVWRRCDEEDINRVIGDNKRDVKLSVMADAEKCDYKTDILKREKSHVDMVRVACYSHQIPLALDMVKDAKDKGYEATLNLMAICTMKESELSRDLEILKDSEADVVYLMDSFGSLDCETVRYLMTKYRLAFGEDKKIGFHAHNNLQMAFAKTIEAIYCGVDFVDVTMAGLGRGAGNCQTELLVGFLGNRNIRPVLKCVQDTIEPLRKDLGWGFNLAYMLAGFNNDHPRDAMAFSEAATPGDIGEFYDNFTKK